MNKPNIIFKSNIFDKVKQKNTLKNFKKISEKIIKKINYEMDFEKNTFQVLSKKFDFNFTTKDLKKFKKFQKIAIIGMGGSILGTEAIYSFLKKKVKKSFFFFDDINFNKIQDFKKKQDLKKILFLVISKSGNTVETITNLLYLKIIKNNAPNIIIVSERKDNFLHDIAKDFNLYFVEHKNYLGGRYSVLSEVGMLPAYLMGLNVKKLRSNVDKYLKKKNVYYLKKSAEQMASILKKKKYKNLIFINYIPELENFLFWLQQLIAESLGKKGLGFLPTVSNAPKDHHSLLQLYLDGPDDKIFYIFSSQKKNTPIIKTNNFHYKIKYLNNRSMFKIKNSQKNALIKRFIEKKISFKEFQLNINKEETLSELISYFILETVLIGKLVNINPFDQPAVEKVKKYTKKLIS